MIILCLAETDSCNLGHFHSHLPGNSQVSFMYEVELAESMALMFRDSIPFWFYFGF